MHLGAQGFAIIVSGLSLWAGCSSPQHVNPLDEPTVAGFDQLQSANTGYGGDGILCGDAGSGYTVELFDFYEARVLRNSSFAPASGDPYVVAQQVIELVRAKDAAFADRLTAELQQFKASARFVPVTLKDVPDQGQVAFQPGCQVTQVAARTANPLPGDPQYLVDERLWTLMDPRNQAGLVLHELVYKYAVAQGYTDSRVARLLNAHLSADGFAAETSTDFAQLRLSLAMDPTTCFSGSTERIWWSPWKPGGELGFADADARCASQPGFAIELGLGADRTSFHHCEVGKALAGNPIWVIGFDGKPATMTYSGSGENGELFDAPVDLTEKHAYLCSKSR